MAFELVPQLSYADLPIAYVLELGGEEFLGLRSHDGGFRQIDSLREVPKEDWQEVEMFGPSLGLLTPCTASIVINDESIGHITISVINGRPGCVSIWSRKHGLTGALLRQLPIAGLVRDATIASTVRVLKADDGIFGARYVDGGLGFGHLLSDLRAELAAVEDRGRRRVVNSAFLAQVADVYRSALGKMIPPAKHVQTILGPTTPANARRWIAAARREGFLGPAPGRGKAGEISGL